MSIRNCFMMRKKWQFDFYDTIFLIVPNNCEKNINASLDSFQYELKLLYLYLCLIVIYK